MTESRRPTFPDDGGGFVPIDERYGYTPFGAEPAAVTQHGATVRLTLDATGTRRSLAVHLHQIASELDDTTRPVPVGRLLDDGATGEWNVTPAGDLDG